MESAGISEKDKEIFGAIGKLIATTEFQDTQTAFFEKNLELFDEEDENKLEYTSVYNDFVKIIEQLIEVKLKEENGVSDEELQGFFESLKNNLKAFEDIDKDILDILFGFIDFKTFKTQMLDAKKNQKREENMEHEGPTAALNEGDYNDFLKLFNEDVNDASTGWKTKLIQKDFKDGLMMNMYQKKSAVSSVDMIRFDCQLKGINPDQLMDFWMNPPKDKLKSLREHAVLEKLEGGGEIHYWRMKMPMMSDRDCVMKIKQTKIDDKKSFFCAVTIDRDDKPPVKGVIRMYISTLGMTWTEDDPNIIHYCEIDNMDMKGYIPARLLNMVMASESQKEFTAMYKHCVEHRSEWA